MSGATPTTGVPQTIPGPYGNDPNVCLPSGAAHYPVDLGGYGYFVNNVGNESADSASIGSLTIASGAGLIVHGESTVVQGDGYQTITLSVNGASTIAAGGSLELLASGDGVNPTPENGHGGNAVLSGPGTITNSGTVSSVSTTTQATASSNAFHNQLDASLVDVPGSTGGVASGYLDINGGPTVTNQSTWTVASGATENILHNGLQTGPSTFANQGSYVNSGATVVGLGSYVDGDPDVFSQSGPQSGNPVDLDRDSELLDASGAGSFLMGNQDSELAGTIPAGQTVTIRGNLYSTDTFTETVTFAGSQVVNQGTLLIDSPDVSPDTYPGTVITGSPLINQGTIDATSEAAGLNNQLDVSLANQHGAVLNVLSGELHASNGQTVTNDGTITVAPGAQLLEDANPFLTGPETFTNAADGTLSPEIASASSYGTIMAGPDSTFNVGGAIAPDLTGGYVPAVGTPFAVLPSDPHVKSLIGTFAAVGAGFAADYSKETIAGDGINVVYGGLPASTGTGSTGSGGTTHHDHPPLRVTKPRIKNGTLRVGLSCPAHGSCPKVTITATVRETLRHGEVVGLTPTRATHAKGVKHRNVVVASVHRNVRAGRHTTVTLKLNRTGRALLARFGRLKLQVTVSAGHRVNRHFKVTLKRAAHHHRHRRHGSS